MQENVITHLYIGKEISYSCLDHGLCFYFAHKLTERVKGSLHKMHRIHYIFTIIIFFASGYATKNVKKTMGTRNIDEILNLVQDLYTDLLDKTNETSREIKSLKQTVSQQQNEIDNLKGN